MQRKGNAIRSESQVKNQISVGIDMGGSLWATAVQDWEAGKMRYGRQSLGNSRSGLGSGKNELLRSERQG